MWKLTKRLENFLILNLTFLSDSAQFKQKMEEFLLQEEQETVHNQAIMHLNTRMAP